MSGRVLLLGVVIAVAAFLASLGTKRVTSAFPDVAAQIEGMFPVDGHMRGEPLADAAGVRMWGSLAGAEQNTGAITLGPFEGPARLRFGVTGFPAQPANEIAVELVASGERSRVVLPVDIGARWNIVDVDLPAAWVGQPVRLVARDGNRTTWIGITEPVRGGRGENLNGLRQTFASWLVNGFLLGLLWCAASQWLARRTWVEPHWQPLLAGAIVALLGYLAFWIYFAHATAGRLYCIALFIAAAAWLVRTSPRASAGRDMKNVALLLVSVGAFYLALLHLFPSSREFDALAANRFNENLPGDNTLPYNFASALYAGQPAKGADAGYYQTSDRPPLQTGWLLLTWPVTVTLRLDSRGAAGTAAVWFQLLWIPAAYGLLRALRLTAARATAWTAVVALSGFFLQHTVFTWPKLGAGAFACGAFGFIMLDRRHTEVAFHLLAGATLAALAWLSHGGAAFSLLAALPWIAGRIFRGEARSWLAAAAIFLLLALPWFAYQRFYDPPANLLIKEHLAGVDERDARSAWTAIRDGYRAAPWPLIVSRKQANFASQLGGNWRRMFDFSAATAAERRSNEFFHTARALTWWTLALPCLLVVVLRPSARLRFSAVRRAHAALLGWAGLTIVIWCLLMFHGGHAVIHQGSYATLLTLFVVGSASLELAGSWTLWLVAGLQLATLATTYGVSNKTIYGPPIGLPFALLAGAALVLLVVRGARTEPSEAAEA